MSTNMNRHRKQVHHGSRLPASSSDDEQSISEGVSDVSSQQAHLHSPLAFPPTKRRKITPSTDTTTGRRRNGGPVQDAEDSGDAFQEHSQRFRSHSSHPALKKKSSTPSLKSDSDSVASFQRGRAIETTIRRRVQPNKNTKPRGGQRKKKRTVVPHVSEEEEEEDSGGDADSEGESVLITQEGEVLSKISELYLTDMVRGAYMTADKKSLPEEVDYDLPDGCHCHGCMLSSCGICNNCSDRKRKPLAKCFYRRCEADTAPSNGGLPALVEALRVLQGPTIKPVAGPDGVWQLDVTVDAIGPQHGRRQFTVAPGCCVVVRGGATASNKKNPQDMDVTDFHPTYIAYVRDIVVRDGHARLHVNYFNRWYDTHLSFPALLNQVDELFLYMSSDKCEERFVDESSLLGLADVEFVQKPTGSHRFYCTGRWYNSMAPAFECLSSRPLDPFLVPTAQVASNCPSCKANAGPQQPRYTLQDKDGQAIHDATVPEGTAQSMLVQQAGQPDTVYRVRGCVYINPDDELMVRMRRFGHPDKPKPDLPTTPAQLQNQKVYPERHRVQDNKDAYEAPYQVGLVTGLSHIHGAIRVRLRMLHRYSQLPHELQEAMAQDRDRYQDVPNLLVLSSDTFTAKIYDQAKKKQKKVLYGPARVAYVEPQDSVHVRLMEMAPMRCEVHYFTHCYSRTDPTALQPVSAKDAKLFDKAPVVEYMLKEPMSQRPLVILDVFSGGGGLSEACRQLGLAGADLHSIEVDVDVAAVFRANHGITMRATLHCCDIAYLVRQFGTGNGSIKSISLADLKGKVDLIIAGPVCHGFTLQNRYRGSVRSQFKRLLVGQLMCLVEMVQPRWLLMENVPTLASYDQSSHINAAMRLLLSANYQVSVMKLNAGNYGVPQNRERLFVWAAHGTLPLPQAPAPMFQTPMASGTDTQTKRRIVPERGGKPQEMVLQVDRRSHCPYRPLWADDVYRSLEGIPATALDDTQAARPTTDLPPVGPVEVDRMGWYVRTCQNWADYGLAMSKDPGQDPLHVLAGLGGKKVHVHTHVHKQLPFKVQARVALVPTADVLDSADWCDIPNRQKGTLKKLTYKHTTLDGSPLLCPCLAKEKGRCAEEVQEDTCIPYALAHSTKRNRGCLGRQHPHRAFPTLVGRIDVENKPFQLHPYEHRQHTTLEQSLAQGFSLDYQYPCSVAKAQSVTGSYVPVPLGACILLQLKKALVDMDYKSCAQL